MMARDGGSPIGVETLDSPAADPAVTRVTLADLARSNTLFGGRGAVAHGVALLVSELERESVITVLDAGAGLGDITHHLARRWGKRGLRLRAVALDWHREAARLCRARGMPSVVGDARALPLRDRAVDIVVASQLLHHFDRSAAVDLVRELNRVARLGVVVADIFRARRAALGIWIASVVLGFHRVTRRDGVVSVRRGFTRRELAAVLRDAGVTATVVRRPGFRLVAAWRVRDAHS